MLSEESDIDEILAARYRALLHAWCPASKRRPRECVWLGIGVCAKCGRSMPTLLDNEPGTVTL